jgi:hypothetical protein
MSYIRLLLPCGKISILYPIDVARPNRRNVPKTTLEEFTMSTREQQIAALEKTGLKTPLERHQARLLRC